MDEVEREGGPDGPQPAEAAELEATEAAPPEAGVAESPPTLLQELATLGLTEEVGLAVAEPPAGEDEDQRARPKVRTSTKVVVVAAAWLLLTLFLVSRFSSDGPEAKDSTRLDQAAAGVEDEAGDEGEEASGDAEAGNASAGEAGDGEYADGAAVYGDDPGARAVSGGAGGGGVYAGVPADASGGVGGGGAVPGAAPGASATATSTPAGAGPGGGSATTVAPAGGGTTNTTAPSAGGGGGATTTTAAPSSGAAPVDVTITISGKGRYSYDTPNITVPSGSRVRMVNTSNTDHTWQIENGEILQVPKDGATSYRTITSTVTFRCTRHPDMTGSITVT